MMLITIVLTPITIILIEVGDNLPITLVLILYVFSITLIILAWSTIINIKDKQIKEKESILVTNAVRKGAQKMIRLIYNNPELNKLIDVKIPILNVKREKVGHQYGKGKIEDIFRDNF